MNENTSRPLGGSVVTTPELIISPDVPDDMRRLLLASEARVLRNPKAHRGRSAWWGLLAPARTDSAMAASLWTGLWLTPKPAAFEPYLWGSLIIGATAVVGWAVGSVVHRKSRHARHDRLHAIRDQYMLWEALTVECRALLSRASTAASDVLKSAVSQQGLIDRQRNEVSLPLQEWEVAESLREYSRLMRRSSKDAQGEKAVDLLEARRRALDLSLASLEGRVAALEAYASQVAEADRRLKELKQIQQLTDGSGDVLDLLARTARDGLAVAEIEGLIGEAAAVAASFGAALESAKQAAVIALPTVALKTA
ncbi:hypothetical protein ACFYYB_26020 [Streptomyces sp. NPDC002886]|uniref:hypothetical protein n=1 Tax=Streptomyces sp. NPDC002886 TaxID=3364667 RepID=UPI003675BD79